MAVRGQRRLYSKANLTVIYVIYVSYAKSRLYSKAKLQ